MTTLLFSQQAIKCVQLSDDLITIHYGDGSKEPIYITSEDTMYEYHKKNFQGLQEKALEDK